MGKQNMKPRTQITFNGPAAWRDALNERAEEWGVPATQIILLAVHLLLRRSDAEELSVKFSNLNAKPSRFVDQFKAGDRDSVFPDLPLRDSLAGAIRAAEPAPALTDAPLRRVRKGRNSHKAPRSG